MKKRHRAYEIIKDEGIKSLIISISHFIWYRYFQIIPTYRDSFYIAVVHFLVRKQILTSSGDFYLLSDNKNAKVWKLPGLRATFHTKDKYKNRITRQFFLQSFCELEEDALVFEVGSYIGASTIGAAEIGKEVYAIEPSPRNIECLKQNTIEYDNVKIVEKAAWNESDTVQINYGVAPDDDSILTPDKGGQGEYVDVEADTISNIAKRRDIEKIDFLKVEAEGVEPEILEGIANIQVEKIAVDCGPERDGELVIDDVSSLLKKMGYHIHIDDKMLYAVNT